MIKGVQISAARALLKLSTGHVAKEVGVDKKTVTNIESGLVKEPRAKTITAIQEFFEGRGIEFIGTRGVAFKQHEVEILKGPDGLRRFFDDVYEYTRENGGTIAQLGIDENLFWATGKDFSGMHRERMADLVAKNDIKVRAILCEGDTDFIAAEYNEYRWIAKEIFSPVPFYIYGDCLAIMDFQTVDPPTIILHKFPAITQAYLKQFYAFWDMAKPVNLEEKTH